METVRDFILGGSKITADSDCSHEIKRCLLFGRKAMTNLDSILKRETLCLQRSVYGFSSSHVWMWELNHSSVEHWRTDAFELWRWRTLESPLDCKEIQPVNPKGNQSWIFTGRTDVKAETPILWPLDAKDCLTGKDPGDGKDWRQEEKGTTEDKVVGVRHQFDGHEFEQALGVGDGQGSLGILQSTGPQRVGHDWVTELNIRKKKNKSNKKRERRKKHRKKEEIEYKKK